MDYAGYRNRLQKAIDFIEDNVGDELPLTEVSARADTSLYHFHRLFRSFVGESLMEYIRHRRLALAALELVETKKSIIDIAFDYGYSAPESFLRAFKGMFGVTPSSFRKRGVYSLIHRKADLFMMERIGIQGDATMEPRFIEKGSFTIFGLLIHTAHASCKQEVAGLWARERGSGRIGEVAARAGTDSVYGVCFGACDGCCVEPGSGTEAFPYLIGWETAKDAVEKGLVEMTIQAGRFAVFTVAGDAGKIDAAVQAIYRDWLPSSGLELADAPTLEKYAVNWKGSPEDSMEIWLPVQARN